MAVPTIDYLAIDGDNHYYEPDDCCTRHLESKYKDRSVHVRREADGTGNWYFADKPLTFARGARDIVMAPGEYRTFMAGNAFDPDNPPQVLNALSPEFSQRDVRLETMDRQGLQACMMIPSFGLAFDAECMDDPQAACAAVSAFNRWGRGGLGLRLSRAHLRAWDDLATRLRHGGRRTRTLARERGTPTHDARRTAERDLASRSALRSLLESGQRGEDPDDPSHRRERIQPDRRRHVGREPECHRARDGRPSLYYTCFGKRPIMDTIACFICHNLFGRYPNLRMLSIENGSTWVPELLKDLDKSSRVTVSTMGDKTTAPIGGGITELPSDIFKRHFYVCPFFEESVAELVQAIGADHVLFGSDWPHPEGVAEPLDFLAECEGVSDGDLKLIMRDNNEKLLGLA